MAGIEEIHAGLFFSYAIGAWAMGLGFALVWVTIVRTLDAAR